MKKVLVVYESIHNGNTERIANLIGECLEGDVFRVGEIDKSIIQDYDVIGFGSGIYFGKHHRSLFELIDEMDRLEKKSFIFSTRTLTPQSLSHRKLKEKLMEKGAKILGEFSCKGESRMGIFKLFGGICKGRPNSDDMRRARDFAENLKKKL